MPCVSKADFSFVCNPPSQPGQLSLDFGEPDKKVAGVVVNIAGTESANQKAQEVGVQVSTIPGLNALVTGNFVQMLDPANRYSFMRMSDTSFEEDAITGPFNSNAVYQMARYPRSSSVLPAAAIPAGLQLNLSVSDTKGAGVMTDGVQTADQYQTAISNTFLNFYGIHFTAFTDPWTGNQALISDPLPESATAQFMGAFVSSGYTDYLGPVGVEQVAVPDAAAGPAGIVCITAILFRRQCRHDRG
jgi:hypothetical protein